MNSVLTRRTVAANDKSAGRFHLSYQSTINHSESSETASPGIAVKTVLNGVVFVRTNRWQLYHDGDFAAFQDM